MDNIPLDDDFRLEKNNVFCTRKQKSFSVACILSVIIVVCVAFIVFAVLLFTSHHRPLHGDMQRDLASKECRSSPPFCNVTLVESIPENLTYPAGSPSHSSIFNGWMELLESAEKSIHIASSYWSLRAEEDTSITDPSGWQGKMIFQRLVDAGKRGIFSRKYFSLIIMSFYVSQTVKCYLCLCHCA